jgi:hypothetical protein
MQLTGADLKDDMASEERWQALKNAMNGKNILLVLDDAWEPDHITDFNFVDETTSSRVLISSRVRELLDQSAIIDLKLPSEENAVEILLKAADIKCVKGAEPPEAVEVVRFCNSLPLALGIAGRLLRSMALGVGDSWTGVVAMLKDEFKDEHGEARAMENSVIRTSLKSIKGKDKQAITNLFLAFALIPEDTACPLDIMEMIYVSTLSDRSETKPPNRFQIRKWLKVLINRSLVYGARFQQKFTPEGRGCNWFPTPARFISLLLPVGTVNCVQTLKVGQRRSSTASRHCPRVCFEQQQSRVVAICSSAIALNFP